MAYAQKIAAAGDDPRMRKFKGLVDRETQYLLDVFERAKAVGLLRALEEHAAKLREIATNQKNQK